MSGRGTVSLVNLRLKAAARSGMGFQGGLAPFGRVQGQSPWWVLRAKPYVNAVYGAKIMSGTDKGFVPKDNLNREQTAVVLVKALTE